MNHQTYFQNGITAFLKHRYNESISVFFFLILFKEYGEIEC